MAKKEEDKKEAPRMFPVTLPESRITLPATTENARLPQPVTKPEIQKDTYYGVKTVDLPEITVKAKAKNWYKDFETNAKKIVNLDSIDPQGNKYETLLDLLVREFGAKKVPIKPGTNSVYMPVKCIGMDDWFPIYVINGGCFFNGSENRPVEMFFSKLDYISTLRVNEIKKLMVLPPGDIPVHYADMWIIGYGGIWQSLVVIETYSDKTYRGDPSGIKTFLTEGLDAPRQFYSPRYEGQVKNNPENDGRTTLLWEPSIKTDSAGYAKIGFFTSDRQSKLEVIVNGVESGRGYPGYLKLPINN